MTRVASKDVACPACGLTRAEYVLTSTNSLGPPDLDGRPGGHARRALVGAIMRCSRCGCCAPDGAQLSSQARGEVSSPSYAALFSDTRLPEPARRWLCWSQISVHLDPGEAAHAALVAAWVCDDAGNRAAARHCRQRYIALKEAYPTDGEGGERRAAEAAVLADVLRRSGDFERAVAVAESEMARQAERNVRALLSFEVERARRRDDRSYTSEHVTQGPGQFADAPILLSRLRERFPRLPDYTPSNLVAATPMMLVALLFLAAWLSDAQCNP